LLKNILIISYSYPPVNAPAAQRPYALAKYLNKSKYNITVITCSNADSSLGFDDSFNEEIENVSLIKIPSKIVTNPSAFRDSSMVSSKKRAKYNQKIKSLLFSLASSFVFPDKAIFWYPNVIKYLKKHKELISKTDIVFTTSPLFTNHLIGNFILKEKKSIRWLVDFRDFHYVENWSKKKGLKALCHKKIENIVFKRASCIVFISAAMQKSYQNYYQNYKDKMDFIYNGFDPEDFKGLSIEPVCNDKLTIFYAGSFYRGIRSPFPLLTLLDEIIEKGYLKLDEIIIKVAGNFEQELLEEAKSFNSFSSIEFLGRIPRTQVLKQLTKADLLWLIIGDKKTHYKSVPLKLFEYLAALRPIINFAPSQSEATKIIEQYNLGVSFDNNQAINNDDLRYFNDLIADYKKGMLSKPLDEKIIDKFTRNKQALQFEKLIDG